MSEVREACREGAKVETRALTRVFKVIEVEDANDG